MVRVLALVVGSSLCGCEGLLNQDGPSPIAPSVSPQASSAVIAAGKVLADARGCGGCHSSQAGEYAGSNRGVSGRTVYAPNITSDMSTGLGQWSDQALINAIRYGFDDEGATLCSEMPREPDLSDADAAKLVAYLRSLPPVINSTTESECTPSPADVALHGKQVVKDNGCMGCHGAGLSGSSAPNLTPDQDTGLGSWSTEQITTAVKTGVDDEGAMLCSTMPRYVLLNDDELDAVAGYLQSLAPVAHDVEVTNCPSEGGDDAGTTNTNTTPAPAEREPDAGPTQAGTGTAADAGAMAHDAGVPDAGTTSHDAGVPDAGTTSHDAGVTDAGTATPDAGMHDAGTPPPPDAGAPTPDAGTATCGGPGVVLAQVYGAGGNTGALFKADFIELHNRAGHAVPIAGWGLRYASATGSSWATAEIPAGTTIAAGAFMVFAVSANGTTGAALPASAVSLPVLNLSATAGKVMLTTDIAPLTGPCPSGATVVDLLGYGGANCSEGAQPGAALTATTAAIRKEPSLSCTDTDVNAADLEVSTPAPHQGPVSCGCP